MKEEYKDLVAFLYDNRELLPPKLRKTVEDEMADIFINEMADIFINELINRPANIIVKEQKNDAE